MSSSTSAMIATAFLVLVVGVLIAFIVVAWKGRGSPSTPDGPPGPDPINPTPVPVVPPTPSSKCKGVTCAIGFVCDPTSGLCEAPLSPVTPPNPPPPVPVVPICVGVVCPTGMSCDPKTGKCTSTPAPPVPVNPTPVPVNPLCTGIVCPTGMSCDPKTGKCTSTPTPSKCTGVVCPTGSRCEPSTGLCISNPITTKCYGVVCPTGTRCDPSSGLCFPTPMPTKCFGVVCPSGMGCDPSSGTCMPQYSAQKYYIQFPGTNQYLCSADTTQTYLGENRQQVGGCSSPSGASNIMIVTLFYPNPSDLNTFCIKDQATGKFLNVQTGIPTTATLKPRPDPSNLFHYNSANHLWGDGRSLNIGYTSVTSNPPFYWSETSNAAFTTVKFVPVCSVNICPTGFSCVQETGTCIPTPPPPPGPSGTSKCTGVKCPTGSTCDENTGQCVTPVTTQKYNIQFFMTGYESNKFSLCSSDTTNTYVGEARQQIRGCSTGSGPMVVTLYYPNDSDKTTFAIRDEATGKFLDFLTGIPTHITPSEAHSIFHYNAANHLWGDGEADNIGFGTVGTDQPLYWSETSNGNYTNVVFTPVTTGGVFGGIFSQSSVMPGWKKVVMVLLILIILLCMVSFAYMTFKEK